MRLQLVLLYTWEIFNPWFSWTQKWSEQKSTLQIFNYSPSFLFRLWKEESTTSGIWITLMTGRQHHQPGAHISDRASIAHALWKCFGRWLPILRARGKGVALSIAVAKALCLRCKPKCKHKTRAKGLTQVKTELDAYTNTNKPSKFSNWLGARYSGSRQCFHWPIITMCGKYPCACLLPERYFVSTCCSPKKGKFVFVIVLVFCDYACVKAVSTVKWDWIVVFALMLASQVKTRLKREPWYISVNSSFQLITTLRLFFT